MNCGLVVHTECCKNNCGADNTVDEYEEDKTDEEEEELDTASTKTLLD